MPLPLCPRVWYNEKIQEVDIMRECVIFCAADFAGLARPIAEGTLVIAADGGLRHTQALGLHPDVVLGDFDSLGYTPQGANVFPVEKDDTDSMLAVRLGLKEGCTEFLLYGSLDGPRLDHTVANFQTLQYLADRGATGYLVGNTTLVTVVKNGKITFPAGKTGTISQKIAMVIQDGDYATAGVWVAIVMLIAFLVIFSMNFISGTKMKNIKHW